MSRTAFAVHFRHVIGVPPLTYLTDWRMRLAERDLRAGASVAQAAEAIGYTSESAFSHAFKRATGMAPGRYRKAIEAEPAARKPRDEEASPVASDKNHGQVRTIRQDAQRSTQAASSAPLIAAGSALSLKGNHTP